MPKQPTGFFDNRKVSHDALIIGQREATRERIAQSGDEPVLLLQDTTSFNFKHHPATEGMGYLENAHTRGFLAHSTLAAQPNGVPLGIWDQQVWARSDDEIGKRHQRHERPFADKESHKWVAGLPEAPIDDVARQVVTVGDAEGHIYEFLDETLARGGEFLVRAAKGRAVTPDGDDLFEAVSRLPVQDRYRLTLQRRPDRPEREALVELRYGSMTLKQPQRAETERETLVVGVVDVIEPHPPKGQKAVHWLLLTSLAVTTREDAQQMVQWYSYRWLIERFHFVLKSGCRIEERQLRSRDRLECLLGVFNLVAWQLLWLTYQARQTPEAGCLVALEEDEWQALYAHIHQTTDMPPTLPTLYEVTRWIAQLGGFLGRTGDGEPGVKVLWRGWSRLQDIVATWRLLRSPPQDVGNA